MQHIDLNNKTILVTGSPGFIGANLVIRLLKEMSGGTVVSLDNMNDYSQEAHKLANERIQEFADDLIPKLVKNQLLENLGDPSVQVLLLDAEKAAASTERKADKELLSELLIHRIQKGESRHVRAGVSHAVKIVDEISDEALLGLTVAHAITNYLPVNANLEPWLQATNNLFEKISYGKLPQGVEWIDHLDILNAIRRHSIGHLKNLKDIYFEFIPGIIDVGIDKETENYQKALDILKKSGINEASLIPHELRDGYVRLCILNINRLDLVKATGEFKIKLNANGQYYTIPVNQQLSEEQKQALRDVYALYEEDDTKLNENKNGFMEQWNSYGALKTIGEWWDSISEPFHITSAGSALAQANAKRCDSSLPDID